MECRGCGSVLTAGARFCAACGTPVTGRCPACGRDLPEDARFCPACGASIERFAPPPEADSGLEGGPGDRGRERKLVTLLFADVVDFTGLNEAHDPELISGLVANTFERLSREIERYEGTVEKFAGDAILAAFGVPVTHEDDPERAVRAALEMQAVAQVMASRAGGGPALTLRVGIETGEVLVDRARAQAERDRFVTGDAVNTAARLQAAAEPGSVVVGPTAYAATRDVVEYLELPPAELKGKALPVAAWRALAIKAGRGDRRGRLGLESPLVGREAELALLKETVRRAIKDGHPHLVTIMGSAGVGKSRLVWELEKYLDGLPEDYHWRKGRCLAYSGSSFGPVADVVKADARIHDDDGPDVARRKLAERLSSLPIGDSTALVGQALEAVLAIGDRRELARDELFEAWRQYLAAIAEVAPLVLVMEDIHWADDGVLAFLDFLARWGEGSIVIVCLARHELLERRGGWGGGLPNATTIVLEPLGSVASSALLRGLLHGDVPSDLTARILELAEGNPLFVEELVRMLVDRGVLRFSDGHWEVAHAVDSLAIPDSVQAVLAARLDSLPVEEKRLAQDAAVVGRIFWDIVLAHLSHTERGPIGDLLRRLRLKDLVVPRKPSSLADASEFGFRHVLIRDVAYDSLPKRDRSRLHRDIAMWAEAELGDRIDEFAELIAGHLAAAVSYEEEFAVADDDLRDLREAARLAALRAARRAAAVSQMDAAGRWIRLSLELAYKLDVGPREIAELTAEFSALAWETTDLEELTTAVSLAIEGLRALADRTDADTLTLARLRDAQAHALLEVREVDEARSILQAALAELEPGPPTPARALLLNRLGWTYWRGGPVAEAVPILERAVAEARACSSERTLRWAIHDLGVALAFLDRSDEAVELLEESKRQAELSGDRDLLSRCYVNLPAVRLGRGDRPEQLVDEVEEGLRLARRSARLNTISWLAANQASVMFEMGRLDDALRYQREAVQRAQEVRSAQLANHLHFMVAIHALRGDIAAALEALEAAGRVNVDLEPQVAEALPLTRAWQLWLDDPAAATAWLAGWASDHADLLGSPSEVALTLARMAVRVGDEAALAQGVALHEARLHGKDAPVFTASGAWVSALPGDGSPSTIEDAASVLEEQGFVVKAANAWADAALLGARAGGTSRAADRAQAIIGRFGLHPLLGPLPETRWTGPPGEGTHGVRRV